MEKEGVEGGDGEGAVVWRWDWREAREVLKVVRSEGSG